MSQAPTRIEHDLLGDRAVPADAYYGIHTLRALENFPITGTAISIYPDLIRALACVKQAAALANNALGLLPDRKADAIARACEEIREGELLDQFVVDVIQGGAGTSTNMNANEVIANRALELLGRARGEYAFLHPVEDVNMSQSTNDVYPTAVKIALHFAIDRLAAAMRELRLAFDEKAREFADAPKMGRTQLQDAVPMTLGQEFSTYAVMLEEDEARLKEAALLITGIHLVTASNLVEATQDAGAFVQLSGVLKRIAVKLSKVCNDLRLLSSGPRAGFGEINLPPVQAGSSIMPGKVNPVIPEVVNQIAFEVIGNDVTVSFAAEAGQLQLNAFEPVIAYSLFKSLMHLRNGCDTLRERCVTGRTVYDLVLEKKLLSKEQLDEILRPEILTRPGRPVPPEPAGGNKAKL